MLDTRSMFERPDPAIMAQDLMDELGLDGLVEAGRRAEGCRRDGDLEGVRFWNTVGEHLRTDAGGPNAAAAPVADSVLWRLMQRVEHFRHRAAQCRSQAEQRADAVRGDLLDMEQHWLELATYAELLGVRSKGAKGA